MKLKPLLIAVLFLAAGAGLAYWLSPSTRGTGPEHPLVGQPLVEPGELEQTRRIELSGDGGESRVVLEWHSAGDWRLPEYHGMPVDFDKLGRLTRSLTEASVQRRVTADPERLERLNLRRNGLVLYDGDGQIQRHFEFGDRGPAGGTYFRTAGEETAFLTDASIHIDSREDNWPIKRPLRLDREEIASFRLPFPGGDEVLLERGAPGEPLAAAAPFEDRELKQSEVNRVLNRLLNARFSAVHDPDEEEAAAAREHAREIVLRDFDGTGYTLRVGRNPAETNPDTGQTAGEAEASPSRAEASIIFDQDGNIVTPPEPEDAPEEAEDAETPEPGPVFIFYASTDEAFPWTRITESAALRFPDSVYEALPESPEDLLEPAAAEDDEESEETVETDGTPEPDGDAPADPD